MPFELRITDAGRAALADGANRGTHAIRLTKMALGSGSGPGGAADDSRTALRMARDTVALSGTSTVSGRIAVRGEFNPTEAYDVTEVAILGRVGSGAEELYAYWTDGGTKIAATLADTRLVIAGSLDIAPAAAEVTVTIGASISLGDPGLSGIVTALGARVDTLETEDQALAQADAALATRVGALEGADFAVQIQTLTDRIEQQEEASVVESIQRGIVTLSASGPSYQMNVDIAAVAPEKAFMSLLTNSKNLSAMSLLSATQVQFRWVSGTGATISYELIEYK